MTPWRPTSWFARGIRFPGGERARAARSARALSAAWQRRDEAALSRALTGDAELLVDAGAGIAVPVRQESGGRAVASALVGLLSALPDVGFADAQVNGTPGLVLRGDGRVVGVAAVGMRGRRVARVWLVLNPDKLAHWHGDAVTDGSDPLS